MDIGSLMKQANKLKAEMEAAQLKAETESYTSEKGGAVSVTLNGLKIVTEVKISPEIFAEGDSELLSELIAAAFNEASEKADEAAKQRMGSLTGGLNIPGL